VLKNAEALDKIDVELIWSSQGKGLQLPTPEATRTSIGADVRLWDDVTIPLILKDAE